MKILSFQTSSLYQNGGQGRVLRRIYENREEQVIVLIANESQIKVEKGQITEFILPVYPIQKKWMRWRIRNVAKWLRESILFQYNTRRIQATVHKIDYDILHVINHGIFSAVLCHERFIQNKQLWVSFHDHFSLCSTYADSKQLWVTAQRRLVISKELGEEYQKLFGELEFEIITDGVKKDELTQPVNSKDSSIVDIYFAGLLHIDYYPLFQVLADAMDQLIVEGQQFKLILRGTQELEFLNNRKFSVDYRSNFISDKEIKKEVDSNAILYLPIKFNLPNFYLYSLSTKMISYLGGSGSILFHGPKDSAAFKLLDENNAAISCTSLEVEDMVNALKSLINTSNISSNNAKILAIKEFDLLNIQNRFWLNN